MKFKLKKYEKNNKYFVSFQILEQHEDSRSNGDVKILLRKELSNVPYTIASCDLPSLENPYTIYIRGSNLDRDNDICIRSFNCEFARNIYYHLILELFKEYQKLENHVYKI